jgi:hypothetical protein
VELQTNLPAIQRQGLALVAISYDSPEILRSFSTRKGITYPLLSDPDSRVIRSYGLLNTTVAADSFSFGIPYPGTFILDRAGNVKSKYFEADYRERYAASDILVREFDVKPGAPTSLIETKHLRLSPSSSETTVHWGQRIALAVDIDLKPGMHVYAPEVEGYIPVQWNITPAPTFHAQPPAWPTARKLYLSAIKETLPVYEDHLRVVAEITLGTDAQVKPLLNPNGDVVVGSSFRYQACDERECYVPETIPLTWTLHYADLDRQRAPQELQHKAPSNN